MGEAGVVGTIATAAVIAVVIIALLLRPRVEHRWFADTGIEQWRHTGSPALVVGPVDTVLGQQLREGGTAAVGEPGGGTR